MLTAEELRLRKTGVSATDVAALVCEHPWRSVDDVFADKVCDPAPVHETTTNIRLLLGHAAEGPLCDHLARAEGLRLVRGTTERHRIHPWILSTPDRDVVSGPRLARDGVGEAKLVGPRVAHHWFDPDGAILPPSYVNCQIQWQMLQRGVRHAWVVVYLMGDPAPVVIHVDYHDELALGLMTIAEKFWTDHVLTRKPPPPTARASYGEMLGRVYPRSRPDAVLEMPHEALPHVLAYDKARAECKRWEDEKIMHGNILREMIADGEGFEDHALHGEKHWIATWKNVNKQPDWKQIALATGAKEPDWKQIAIDAGASPELIAQHTPLERRLRVDQTKTCLTPAAARALAGVRLAKLVEAPLASTKEPADESAA